MGTGHKLLFLQETPSSAKAIASKQNRSSCAPFPFVILRALFSSSSCAK